VEPVAIVLTPLSLAAGPLPLAATAAPAATAAAPVPMPRSSGFSVDTPALGPVGAELTHRDRHDGSALHVHFAVDRSGSAALIASASGNLGRTLAATGNRLDAVTVAVREAAVGAPTDAPNLGAGGSGSSGDAARHQSPAPRQSTPLPPRLPLIKAVVRDRFA
jgi:hypothetical protein